MKKYYTEAEVEVIKNKLSEKIAIGVILSSLMTIVWAFIDCLGFHHHRSRNS